MFGLVSRGRFVANVVRWLRNRTKVEDFDAAGSMIGRLVRLSARRGISHQTGAKRFRLQRIRRATKWLRQSAV
jgi:hypothetical protein